MGFNTGDNGANFSTTNPKGVAVNTGGAWVQTTGSYLSGSTASATNQNLAAGQTKFYGVSATGGLTSITPVELTAFTAKNNGQSNVLTWTTASEKNNAEFQIERSDDGQNFKTIGTVKGNGTTAITHDYTFSDDAPLSTSYYRLNQFDNDGASNLSKIVSVVRSGFLGQFKIYPSPSQNTLTVDIVNSTNETLLISDLVGRQWLEQKANPSGQTLIDISKLPHGTYLLTIKMPKMQVTERFVKMN